MLNEKWVEKWSHIQETPSEGITYKAKKKEKETLTSMEWNRIKLLSRNYWAAVFGELKVCWIFHCFIARTLDKLFFIIERWHFFFSFFWFATNLGPVAIYNNIWLLHVWHFNNDRLITLLKRTQCYKSKAKLNPDSLNRLALSRCKRHFARACTQSTLTNAKKKHRPTALRFEWNKTKRLKWKIEGKIMHKSNRIFSFSELELIIRWRV